MSKKDIIVGKITNTCTDEEFAVEFQPYFTDLVLMAIIKVEKADVTEITLNDENNDSAPITVDCKALDSMGFIYNLGVIFMPETAMERAKIAADMKNDAIFVIKGRYSINQKNQIINVIDPKYRPLPPSFSEEEVKKAFQVNVNPLTRIN